MKTAIFFSALFLLTLSASAQEKQAGKIITNYFAWIDAGNLDAVGTILAEDLVATASFSPTAFDKTAWRGVGQGFKTAFPDMKHEVVRWFADDNSVAVDGIFRGTNTGPNMGNPPTGNRVAVPFTTLFELNGRGMIKSVNVRFDTKQFESQLMAGLPDPKAAAEKTIRDLFDAMDAGQVDRFDQFCSADFRISNPFLPGPSPIGAFKGILQAQKTGFPDIKHEVVEMVSDGGTVVTKGIFRGTNTGSMMGKPATGNKVVLPFLVLDKLDAQGKLAERFVQFDAKSFESQLMAGIDPNAGAEATVRGIMAAADAGDTEKLLSFFAPGAKHYFGGQPNTNDELKGRVTGFKAAFPDIRRDLQVVSACNGSITVQGWLTGTNTGAFMGKPATGKSIRVSALGIYKVGPDGKVTEAWVELDSAAMMAQLKGDAPVK